MRKDIVELDIVRLLRARSESWEVDGEITLDCVDSIIDREAADEIERLRALITEWVDAVDFYDTGETTQRSLDVIEADLRKAVGR